MGVQKVPNLVLSAKTVQARDPLRIGADLERGFSMLELLLVMAIITTVAAIAVPRYQGSSVRYRADPTGEPVF